VILYKTIKLFLIGIVISVFILELEDVGNFEELQQDPVNYLINSYSQVVR